MLQCKNEEEVVAVIAHELGHWKLSHTMYSFVAMQVRNISYWAGRQWWMFWDYYLHISYETCSYILVICLPFSILQILTLLQFGGYTLVRNSKELFESFGFQTQPVLIGLILFQVCIVAVILVLIRSPPHCNWHQR